MSDQAVVGGVLAGALFLPLIAGALLVGGVFAGVMTLAAAVALVAGLSYPYEAEEQECLRCGEPNVAENAVCEACKAQL
jgi:hypothetical protein